MRTSRNKEKYYDQADSKKKYEEIDIKNAQKLNECIRVDSGLSQNKESQENKIVLNDLFESYRHPYQLNSELQMRAEFVNSQMAKDKKYLDRFPPLREYCNDLDEYYEYKKSLEK